MTRIQSHRLNITNVSWAKKQTVFYVNYCPVSYKTGLKILPAAWEDYSKETTNCSSTNTMSMVMAMAMTMDGKFGCTLIKNYLFLTTSPCLFFVPNKENKKAKKEKTFSLTFLHFI